MLFCSYSSIGIVLISNLLLLLFYVCECVCITVENFIRRAIICYFWAHWILCVGVLYIQAKFIYTHVARCTSENWMGFKVLSENIF